MVHDGVVTRDHFRGANPLVLGKTWVDDEVLILDRPFGWNRKGMLAHRQHHMRRFGQPPSVDIVRWRWQVVRVAVRHSRIDPSMKQLLVLVWHVT